MKKTKPFKFFDEYTFIDYLKEIGFVKSTLFFGIPVMFILFCIAMIIYGAIQ